eukprot:6490283-Heterocapsa_arctica.AAC.1
MGIDNTNYWSVLLKLNIGLRLRCCGQLSAFREESNGDSEDARRPCTKGIHLREQLKTVKNL